MERDSETWRQEYLILCILWWYKPVHKYMCVGKFLFFCILQRILVRMYSYIYIFVHVCGCMVWARIETVLENTRNKRELCGNKCEIFANEYNCDLLGNGFVCTQKIRMKCLLIWIPLRICVSCNLIKRKCESETCYLTGELKFLRWWNVLLMAKSIAKCFSHC